MSKNTTTDKRNKRFKIARIQSGLTQRDLAEQANVSESLITKIETHRISYGSLNRAVRENIAAILNKATFELF